MTPYNQIFQLHNKGLNNSQIEKAIGSITRKTVITVLKLTKEKGFVYSDQTEPLTDTEIHRILHSKKDKGTRMPDIDSVMFDLSLPKNSIAKIWKCYSEKIRMRIPNPLFSL